MTEGIVTDIQRFSLHDGPGIRTTVFLKGCNLRCFWCHNPETLRPESELQVFPDRCIHCGRCAEVCRSGARTRQDDGVHYDRSQCAACGACAGECYAEALTLVGRRMTAAEVVLQVLRDRPFYDTSGGGVTLSGGEPLFQLDFAEGILRMCKAEGLHTAIESNMAWPARHIDRIVRFTDLVMMDIKTLDDRSHREWTGSGVSRVLAGARRLSERSIPVVVRTPVIPGFNDSNDAIRQIATFVAGLSNLVYYELLPYHPLGTSKLRGLGRPDESRSIPRPTDDRMRALARIASDAGARVKGQDP